MKRSVRKRVKLFILGVTTVLALNTVSLSESKAQTVDAGDGEKCSAVKQEFKLCVESPIIVRSGEPIRIYTSLFNLSETRSRLNRPSMLAYKVVDESGNALVSIFDRKAEESGVRITEEFKSDWKENLKGGSSVRTLIDAKTTQQEIVDISLIYTFPSTGKYSITVKRNLPSKDGGTPFDLIVENILVDVR